MKKLLTLIALVASSAALHAQMPGSWQWVNPVSSNATANKITYAGNNTYYMVGGGTTVSKSTDGGQTWKLLNIAAFNNGTFNYKDVSFVDANTGYVAGDSAILKTTDGGASWINLYDRNNAVVAERVDFVDASTGWLGAYAFKKTIDGGITWTDVTLPDRNTTPPLGIYMKSATQGTVIAGDLFGTKVYQTTDGDSWTQLATAGMNIDNGCFADNNNGCLYKSSFGDTVYTTANGGSSWTRRMLHDSLGMKTAATYFDNNTILIALTNERNYKVRVTRLARSADAGNSWNIIDLPASTPEIKSFGMESATVGFAVGDGGVMLKTTDGGLTWTNANGVADVWARGGAFHNENNGVICGERGEIYYTTSGGTSWIASGLPTATPSGSFLHTVAYITADSVAATGYGGYVMMSADAGKTFTQLPWTRFIGSLYGLHYHKASKTIFIGGRAAADRHDLGTSTDGGLTWALKTLPGVGAIMDFHFVNDQLGFAAGSDSITAKAIALKTTDGGMNWTVYTLPSAENNADIQHIHFSDANNGWIITTHATGNQAWKTTDGGTAWTLETATGLAVGNWPVKDIYFKDANNGYISGSTGFFNYTTDGGTTWVKSGLRTNQSLVQFMPAGNKLYLLSDFGGILSADGGPVSAVQFIGNSSQTIHVKVYPNPSSAVVNIDVKQDALISLYNLTGKLQLKITGNKIDVSTLAKGVYFLQVSTIEGVSTQKLVVE